MVLINKKTLLYSNETDRMRHEDHKLNLSSLLGTNVSEGFHITFKSIRNRRLHFNCKWKNYSAGITSSENKMIRLSF